MAKEKRILIYFISFLLGLLTTMLIGITDVFAATYQMNYNYEQRYYDNYGSSVVAVPTSWMDSFGSYVSNEITTYANSYGAGLSITSPIPLLSGHTYSFSVYFEGLFNIALSSKNEISIASSLNAAANDYANNIPGTELLYSKVSNNSILQFVFKADNNHTHLFFPWTTTTTTTQSYVVTEIVMEDLGSSGVSEQDINNSLNNQTNEINNSIENSTNTITGSITDTENNINQNIDDMEQSIVDSNKETQEVIKDQFNDCYIPLNSINSIRGQGSNYIEYSLNKNLDYTKTVYLKFNSNIPLGTTSLLFYYSSGNQFRVSTYEFATNNEISFNFTQEQINLLNSSTGIYPYIRFYKPSTNSLDFTTVNISNISLSNYDVDYNKFGEEICSNKLDEQNDKLDGIQDALTDTSTPNLEILGDTAGWLPPGPLDSVLNLPLTMMNNLLTNLGRTCSTFRVELPFVNKNIEIPCVENLMEQMGALVLWRWVGRIASVIILYSYLMNLYAWADKILTLRAELDEAMGVDLANWGRL